MAKNKKLDANQAAKRILDITTGDKPNIPAVKREGKSIKGASKK